MRQTLRILAFFPLAALAARSLVVLIAVVSAGGESFAEVVADPVAGIVRGTETPGPDYAPPQIGNGELNTTVDWLGGSSHPSPCSRGFFLAARRIIQPKRELFGQGRIETVVETNGRLEKLELTPRTTGKSHPMTVVLPEGLRKPSRFTVDVR